MTDTSAPPVGEPGEVELERPYLVPTHLKQQDTFGIIPSRTFYVEMAAGLLGGPIVGFAGSQLFGDFGWGMAALPMLAASPFAMLLEPRAEHGLAHRIHHTFRRRKLSHADLERMMPARAQEGRIDTGYKTECRAVFRMPTVNMAIASQAQKRAHRQQWGLLIDTSPHPCQIIVPGRPSTALPIISALRKGARAEQWELASYLSYSLHRSQMVDRDRLIVVPAHSPDELEEFAHDFMVAYEQIQLAPERIEDPDELRSLLGYCWGTRPDTDCGLPNEVRLHAKDLEVDGTWAQAWSLGKVPAAVQTNWLAKVLDGEIPCDTAIDIAPESLEVIKFRLGLKLNQLRASRPSASRDTAIPQIQGLHMALEQRRVLPYNVRITFVVRGDTREQMNDRGRQLVRRVKTTGGIARLLKWEQLEGLKQVVPVRALPLPNREHLVETGTLTRATPLAQATLQMEDGVPFGNAGYAPCTWTCWHRLNPAKHATWLGKSGIGKGLGARVYLSREYLSKGIRIFGIDQDPDQEWSGRFTWYCGGRSFVVEKTSDLELFRYEHDDGVVFFNLAHLRHGDLATTFKRIKELTIEHTLRVRFPSFFVIDEATHIAKSDAKDDLAEIATQGRHWNWSGQFITQLVTHWFGSDVGSEIQDNCPTKLYSGQESTQIDKVAQHVRWTADERDRIEKAGIGQFLLVTAGRRVWVDLYKQCSAAEYAMANTDPPEASLPTFQSVQLGKGRWRVHRRDDERLNGKVEVPSAFTSVLDQAAD